LYNVIRQLRIIILKLKEKGEDQMEKIYIIDDDQDIVESISMVLKANGYEVSAQYNDEDVVENVSKYDPDLIILDVIFPEDSSAGFKMAREIKSDDKLVKIPIIMLSAVNEKGIFLGRFSDQDIDQSWLPVNKFLEKPVQPKELLRLVKSVLSGE
jgi:CheY-like chemotaxis protein